MVEGLVGFVIVDAPVFLMVVLNTLIVLDFV
jgi:hypothetical protein